MGSRLKSWLGSTKRTHVYCAASSFRSTLSRIGVLSRAVLTPLVNLSLGTIKSHVASILRKLGVQSRAAAIAKLAQAPGWNVDGDAAGGRTPLT